MSESGSTRFTDVMVNVSDVDEAVTWWSALLGEVTVGGGAGWKAVTDTRTGQRLVFTAGDFGGAVAVAVQVDPATDVRALADQTGVTVVSVGETFTTGRTPHGAPVVFYVETG